jgi:hypothetical protein
MRAEGLEPPRAFAHQLLSSVLLVCFPVKYANFAGSGCAYICLSCSELGTRGGHAVRRVYG